MHDSMSCENMDCITVGIDAISVSGSTLLVTSPVHGPYMPACAVGGRTASGTATGVGVACALYGASHGRLSGADLSVNAATLTTGFGSRNPRISLAADVVQFVWDFFVSPNQ